MYTVQKLNTLTYLTDKSMFTEGNQPFIFNVLQRWLKNTYTTKTE